MNHTTNYQLNQWEKTDRILMEDFNADNLKTEQALSALAAAVAAADTRMEGFGNCQIYTQTYTGNGSTSRTLTFPAAPVAVLLAGGYATVTLVKPSSTGIAHSTSNPVLGITVGWSGTSVSWSGQSNDTICNKGNTTYAAVALCAR